MRQSLFVLLEREIECVLMVQNKPSSESEIDPIMRDREENIDTMVVVINCHRSYLSCLAASWPLESFRVLQLSHCCTYLSLTHFVEFISLSGHYLISQWQNEREHEDEEGEESVASTTSPSISHLSNRFISLSPHFSNFIFFSTFV